METLSDHHLLDKVSKNMEAAHQIIEKLQWMGYHCHFELNGTTLTCVETNMEYHHLTFHVDDIFRIEGGILQSNGFTIFALRHRSDHLRGIFLAI